MAHRGILRRIPVRSTLPPAPRAPRRGGSEDRVWRVLKLASTLEEAVIGQADSLSGARELARWLAKGGAPYPLLIVEGTPSKVFGTVVERIEA